MMIFKMLLPVFLVLVTIETNAGMKPLKRRTASAGRCEASRVIDLKSDIQKNCIDSTSVFAEAIPNQQKRAEFCECVSKGHAENLRARPKVYQGKEYFILCLHKQAVSDQQYQDKQFEDIIEVDAAIMDDCLNKAGVE